MKKNELIWREILTQFLEKKVISFTQKNLAERFRLSVSTVFHALEPLRSLGAVSVRGRGFELVDYEKVLIFWSTHRRLDREILYRTHVDGGIRDIESGMTPDAIFAAYSAWKFRFRDAPADYDTVYVYADGAEQIRRRFPPSDRKPVNLVVWKADPFLRRYDPAPPLAQLFADFWNLPEWYAKEFLAAAKERIVSSTT